MRDLEIYDLQSEGLDERQMFILSLTEMSSGRWKARGMECYNDDEYQ